MRASLFPMAGSGPRDAGTEHSAVRPGIPGAGEKRGFPVYHLQYEMCYTNVLQALDLAGIPLHAVERTGEDPIVIGGGPCTYNPEPIAPFFDLFYIGEGEVVYDQLFDTYLENKKNGGTRLDFLKKACRIPGIYVPQFYEVTYHEDGTVAAFTPSIPEAPEKIKNSSSWI